MNDWTICRFEPLDVIVSADARPLDVGGFGHAGDLMPSAFAGSLRTLILKRAGFFAERGALHPPADNDEAKRAARVAGFALETTDSVVPALNIFGPLYSTISGQLLMPAPRSALWGTWTAKPVALGPLPAMTDRDLDGCHVLTPESQSSPSGRSLDTDPRWWPLRRVAWWLSRDAGVASTAGGLAPLAGGERDSPVELDGADRSSREPPVSRDERRWGHARTGGGVPEDGALFSRSVRRFHQESRGRRLASASYAVLFRGDQAYLASAAGTLVRLGGDGHLAQLSIPSGRELLAPAQALLDVVTSSIEHGATGVQMYLATPALFDEGWRPRVLGEALRLRAAAVGRPRTIAGWDLRNRKPKPVRRAVPAGSVYFFDVVDRAGALKAVRTYHLNKSVSDEDPALGFGCALFGVWRTEGHA